MKEFTSHPKNLVIGKSQCCDANTAIIPACLGDPSMTICTNCCHETITNWKPVYENVGQGTWRKIEYPVKSKDAIEIVSNETPKQIDGN
jgi:hypothetical protein